MAVGLQPGDLVEVRFDYQSDNIRSLRSWVDRGIVTLFLSNPRGPDPRARYISVLFKNSTTGFWSPISLLAKEITYIRTLTTEELLTHESPIIQQLGKARTSINADFPKKTLI